jgi:hypothetical protein
MESKPLNNQINDDKNVEGKNGEENKENFQKDKYKKKGEYPNFLLKLYQILENESYKNIIHWTEDGKYFIISNLHDFTEQILPHYYKHNNYSSFIRQLNMYDFHKKKSGQNEHVFHHENFIRNRKDLLKLIKRKSKKENIPMNNQNNLIQLYNSNKYNKNNILDWKNNAINLEKHPLSIDDDINLNNSIHSLFSNNKNAQNKYLPQSSIFTNNINNNNINNENYNKKLNDDILNNYKMENNEKKMKITKTNLQNLLTSLTHTIDNDIEKEKLLEAKIENLSKQNEEFMSQNKKILQEIISKKEYNQKLETVIRFIFEFLKPKSNNKYKTNSMNIKNLIEDDKNNQNGLINLSCQANDISDIISNKNYSSRNEGLDPFQDFLNKYLRYNKNGIIPNNKNNFMNQDFNYFYNYDKNTNNDSNINNVKTLRRNLLCSGKEEDNYKAQNKLINIKRKRSGSLSSILSDISKESKESKIIYNDNKAKNEGDKEEKIEEKKYEEENMTPNMNVISEVNNESFDSLNKSKNVFDIDFPQEENKSDNNEFSQDLLNNSCTTFNYMYNNSYLNNNSDVFNDVNK